MYKLTKAIYLDNNQEYSTIITISPKPKEELIQQFIKKININLYNRINHFRSNNKCNECQYVFKDVPDIEYCTTNNDNIVLLSQLPDLLIFLDGLNYKIDNCLTKTMFLNKSIMDRDFIGFLKYDGE